jgi:hypothetical protein
MKLPRRKFVHLAAGAAGLPAVSRFAKAQSYPTRPITMIVPVAAGGLTDVVGRAVADPTCLARVLLRLAAGSNNNDAGLRLRAELDEIKNPTGAKLPSKSCLTYFFQHNGARNKLR